jgi:shikimate dehydrogenase
MKKFGLIGFPLEQSFSKTYFTEKFKELGLKDYEYNLYPLEALSDFPQLIQNEPELAGLNVTIPYKIGVMFYLDSVSEEAKAVDAVNCIKITQKDLLTDYFSGELSLDRMHLEGFNTDVYGFEESLKPLLRKQHTKALVLGHGGAARAVTYVLKKLHIEYSIVSRKASHLHLSYSDLTKEDIQNHKLIIDTTPVGTYPDIHEQVDIPYSGIGKQHLLYDLVYNPFETEFLKRGRLQGAVTKNGLEMLHLQAEKSWEIWQG